MSEKKSISKNTKAIRKGLKNMRADNKRNVLEVDLPKFPKDMSQREFWEEIQRHLQLRGFKISQI